ncbi:alpha/beta fold hydrolase [Marinihelvus fidelis]|nr:alpha/beta fold hydrolase [Marinihelvus fidelis]
MKKVTLAATCLAIAAITPTAWALPDGNTIEFSNCMLSMPGSPATAAARCGRLEVPENPDEPGGRMISLHIAVADASDPQPEADPLFFFAGGPGQAATETWPMIRGSLRGINKTRDIVMIDQRGTGGSNKLQCPAEDMPDLNAEVDFDEIARLARECLAGLDADTRYYTTTIAAGDVDAVRRAMGYEQVNIMGVSYGTRAAQVYLREFPDRVRTMTLDSVVPMQLALGQEHALMLDSALNRVLDDCAADAACRERFPDPRQGLARLLADLRSNPRSITIINPVTGEQEPLTVTAETLAVAIRFLSYSSESQAVLPLLLHEAVTEDRLDRLATQAMMVVGNLGEMIARGMEMSVMCAEDYPFMNFGADYSDTLIGNLMLKGIQAQCREWPAGKVPDDFHEPFQAELPVLLLSGERDPVTPPAYATRAAAAYPNHLDLVADGLGHSVLRNVCLQQVATDFITTGSVDEVDTACVDDIEGSPFFTTLLGPEP